MQAGRGIAYRFLIPEKERVAPDGSVWACAYKEELTISDCITQCGARARARSPGNPDKDGTMISPGGISRARAREFRDAFGLNLDCDLGPNASEQSESDDILPASDMAEDANSGDDGP